MWPDPRLTQDLVTYTEEIVNGKLHFWAAPGQYFHYTETSELIFNSNNLTGFYGNIGGLTAVNSWNQ